MSRILIVDDEEIIRKRLKKILTLNDHDVYTAENGIMALEMFDDVRPTIVLQDIKMPGMDGLEVLKEIRKKDYAREFEVIMITGHGDVEISIEAMENGAFGYLKKPIDLDELEINIKKVENKIETNKKLKEYTEKLELKTRELNDTRDKINSFYEQLQSESSVISKSIQTIFKANNELCPQVKIQISKQEHSHGDIVLCYPKPSGGLYAFLGDFSGHGMPGAMGIIPVAETFYSMANRDRSIQAIIREINGKIKHWLPTETFLAACLIEVNRGQGSVSIWNAGIPDILVAGSRGGIKKRFVSKHLPLGIVGQDKLDLSVDKTKLDRMDRIYLFSDGVLKTVDKNGRKFSQDNLDRIIGGEYNPDNVLGQISAKLDEFRSGVAKTDDITMIEILCDNDIVWEHPIQPNSEDRTDQGWQISLDFRNDSLGKLHPPSMLMDVVERDEVLRNHKGDIYVIISELFLNAMDYGILGMDEDLKKDANGFEKYYELRSKALDRLKEGWVKINLEFIPQKSKDQLIIKLEHSGSGFDHEQNGEIDKPAMFHNQGLMIVRQLCKELTYYDSGNRVKAVYELN